jgi:hypothetical protein
MAATVKTIPHGIIGHWGVEVTAGGGNYDLCWRSGLSAGNATSEENITETANTYRVRFGTFTLVGPHIDNDATCTSGRLCIVHLGGRLLSNGEKVVLLDTCGVHSVVSKALSVRQLYDATPNRATISWPADTISAVEDSIDYVGVLSLTLITRQHAKNPSHSRRTLVG